MCLFSSSEACFPFVSLYCRSVAPCAEPYHRTRLLLVFTGIKALGGLQYRLFLLKSAKFLYPVSSLSFRAYPIMLNQRKIECYTHRDILGDHIEISIQRFRSLIMRSIRVMCVGYPLTISRIQVQYPMRSRSLFKLPANQFTSVVGSRFSCQRNLIRCFLFMEKGSGCSISKEAFRLILMH